MDNNGNNSIVGTVGDLNDGIGGLNMPDMSNITMPNLNQDASMGQMNQNNGMNQNQNNGMAQNNGMNQNMPQEQNNGMNMQTQNMPQEQNNGMNMQTQNMPQEQNNGMNMQTQNMPQEQNNGMNMQQDVQVQNNGMNVQQDVQVQNNGMNVQQDVQVQNNGMNVQPNAQMNVQQEQPNVQQEQTVQMPQVQQETQNLQQTVVKDAPITNFDALDEDIVDFSNVSSPTVDAKPKQISAIEYNGFRKLLTLSPGNWGIFYNLLTFISSQLKKDDVINIENGKINTIQSSTLIECNLTQIVGMDLDLKIGSPEIFIKKCKTIIGGDQIQIFADDNEQQYYFCKIKDEKITTRVPIPYVAESAQVDNSMIPDGLKPISVKEIGADEMMIIKTLLTVKGGLGYENFNFAYTNEPQAKLAYLSLNSSENGEIKEIFHESDDVSEYAVSFPFTSKTSECIVQFFKESDEIGYIQCINNIGGSTGTITLTEKVRAATDLDSYVFNN